MKDITLFLDIDGVLNHFSWMKSHITTSSEKRKQNNSNLFICPDNVLALNFLLTSLQEKNYQPSIVISSTHRYYMSRIVSKLKESNLNYKNDFNRTHLAPLMQRGYVISKFIKNNNVDEFIVIDDRLHEIDNFINKDKILLSDGFFNGGLTHENVFTYINSRFGKNTKTKNADCEKADIQPDSQHELQDEKSLPRSNENDKFSKSATDNFINSEMDKLITNNLDATTNEQER